MYRLVSRLGAWLFASTFLATAQVAILQIQIIEGDGAVHPPGTRTSRALTVEVTDETGKPVPGSAVSFHLPEDGPGGTFLNGLRTEVATTDSHGRASLHGLQVNRTPGKFEIRIVASKEQARAGMVSAQYIAGSSPVKAVKGRSKWVMVAAVAGGVGVAAILAAGKSGGAATPAVTASAPTLTIGTPAISVRKP